MYNLSTINEYKLHNKNTPIENLLYYTEESIYITESVGLIAIIIALIGAIIVIIIALFKKTGIGIKVLAAIKGYGKVISEFFKKRSTSKKESYYFKEEGENNFSDTRGINIENDRLVKINQYCQSNPKELNTILFPSEIKEFDHHNVSKLVGIDASKAGGIENSFKNTVNKLADQCKRCIDETNGEDVSHLGYDIKDVLIKLNELFNFFGMDPTTEDGIHRFDPSDDGKVVTIKEFDNGFWEPNNFNLQKFQNFCSRFISNTNTVSEKLKQKVKCDSVIKLAEIADRNIDLCDILSGFNKTVPSFKYLQSILQTYQNDQRTGNGIQCIKSTFDVVKNSCTAFDSFSTYITNFDKEVNAYLKQIANSIGMTPEEIAANIVDIENKFRIFFK